MKWKTLALLAILPFCASCVIKPGYRKELHSPLFAERSGRLFESSRRLGQVAESSAWAWTDSCIGLDAERMVGAPLFLAANIVLCPVYDVVNLPRDLYLQNRCDPTNQTDFVADEIGNGSADKSQK